MDLDFASTAHVRLLNTNCAIIQNGKEMWHLMNHDELSLYLPRRRLTSIYSVGSSRYIWPRSSPPRRLSRKLDNFTFFFTIVSWHVYFIKRDEGKIHKTITQRLVIAWLPTTGIAKRRPGGPIKGVKSHWQFYSNVQNSESIYDI